VSFVANMKHMWPQYRSNIIEQCGVAMNDTANGDCLLVGTTTCSVCCAILLKSPHKFTYCLAFHTIRYISWIECAK